jgi:hypothetical protein
MAIPRPAARCALLAASAALLSGGLAGAPDAADAATSLSSNWGGYAATGTKFRRVSATWVVRRAACASGSETFSAAWVGLGGYSETSQALEQTGTEVDCSSAGRAYYSAWYELVPDTEKTVRMKVRAGDTVAASVEVRGTSVSLRLRDRTTGGSFSKTIRMSSPDVTSAEWIVEAPSACRSNGRCTVLPLTNFGTLSFTHASATSAGGHTGSISDAAWSANAIVLNAAGSPSGFATAASAAGAVPSGLASGGSSFWLAYQQLSGATASGARRTLTRSVR